MARAQAGLWPENVEAWILFQRVASRCVHDLQLASTLVQIELEGRERSEALDLLDRLTLCYDLVIPRPNHGP